MATEFRCPGCLRSFECVSNIVDDYCRQIEAYLCRKNDGHLIRITGPAFEHVSRWAALGIPLKVACEGIDRYFERYYRKGQRRRPVRIEFCEADVLDAFDNWRRAVGVAPQDEERSSRSRESLAAHLERAIARLTALRASGQASTAFEGLLERSARELDRLQPLARSTRGSARDTLLARLAALDRELMTAVLETLDEAARGDAAADATTQLAPFRQRMTGEAYERARAAAIERHVRERFHLPTISFT